MAAAELDETGLLQVHGLSKSDPLGVKVREFAQFTSRQVSNLPRDSQEIDPQTVDRFVVLLQARLAQAEQQTNPVKAALLQRSMPSAGSPVAKVIDQITALPLKTQEALALQARDSKKLKETLASLPVIPEIQSLLLQMDELQNPFDPNDNTTQRKPIQGVDVTWNDDMTCNDEAVRTKVRTTTTGWTTTTTHHNSCGTMTETLNGKNGFRHFHQFSHNGRGGNASTVTESSFGCWEFEHNHAHSVSSGGSSTESSTESTICDKNDNAKTLTHGHSHDFTIERGVDGKKTTTRTETESTSVDDDGDSWSHTHTHSHEHQHQTGVGTSSESSTQTETAINGKVRHSHTQNNSHFHNEQTGDFGFSGNDDEDER